VSPASDVILLLFPKYGTEGLHMNHDHIILAMLALGGIVGFFLGYSKGHDHGKIAGRIAYRKTQRQLEQVGR
jgi:hypothetical protein